MGDNVRRREETPQQHPPGLLSPVILCILAAETGERFCFYGFRAILVLYFVNGLEFSENEAIALFAYTTALAYFSPLVGALLADSYLGRYRTILWFGVVYLIGLVLMTEAAWSNSDLGIRRSLTLVALLLRGIGTGGIKPCVSAFGADQILLRPTIDPETPETEIPPADDSLACGNGDGFAVAIEEENAHSELVRNFFAYFYFGINAGCFASIALIPIVRAHLGYGPAFGCATVVMAIAILLFLSKRHEYVHHVPGNDRSSMTTTFRLCWWLLRQNLSQYRWFNGFLPFCRPGSLPIASHGRHTLVPTEDTNSPEEPPATTSGDGVDESADNANQHLFDAAQTLHVFPILAMLPIFWALHDQQGSVWTLQASKMQLHGFKPEQLYMINPLEIMVFVPLFNSIIYPAMQSRGWDIAPHRRMSWGMVLIAVAFSISGIVESWIDHHDKNGLELVNVFWLFPQFTILSVAEIFVGVTGLEFAYATAPHRLKAFVLAIYLSTQAIGNLISGMLYSTIFAHLNRATVMHVCAVLMLVNLALFHCMSRWWERRNAKDLLRCISMGTEGAQGEQELELQEREIV